MSLLTPEQKAAFERDGYVILRGFYSPEEMAQLTGWVEEMQHWPDAPGRWWRYYETSLTRPGRRLLNRMEHFYDYHPGIRSFIDGRLREAVGELLGEPAVLFKEKINFKLPGGDGFKPHQDHQAGWSRYARLCISALVGIDRATEENGCLEIAPGQHKRGMFAEWKPLGEAEMAQMRFVACPTEPGDVVLFDSFTPHGSQPNRTDQPRRLMFITYNGISDGDQRARYYADKRASYPQDCEREPDKEYVFRV